MSQAGLIFRALPFAACLLGAIVVATTNSADGANASTSYGLRQLTIPATYPHFERGSTGVTAVGIDRRGRILVYVDGCNCGGGGGEIVRYDPRARRFIRGHAFLAGSAGPYLSPAGSLWELSGFMGGQRVDWAAFAAGGHAGRFRYLRPSSGEFNDIAFAADGRAWIAGWSSRYPAYRPSPNSKWPHAAGLPMVIPRGRAALFHAWRSPYGLKARLVPVPAPLTGVTVDTADKVWAFDPYRVCLHWRLRHMCRGPRLVEFDRAHEVFRVFPVPRSSRTLFPSGKDPTYARTPMATGPDGSVWTEIPRGGYPWEAEGLTLTRFRYGRFASYHVRHAAASDMFVGPNNRIWLSRCGRAVVFDPSSRAVVTLQLKGGVLLRGAHGPAWNVRIKPKKGDYAEPGLC